MKPQGHMKPCDGYAYELHEVEQGSVFELPDTENRPRLWAIKTDTAMQKDGLNIIVCTVIGVETEHKGSHEFHPGQSIMLQENTYILPADVDVYRENNCVFRTFLEQRSGQII